MPMRKETRIKANFLHSVRFLTEFQNFTGIDFFWASHYVRHGRVSFFGRKLKEALKILRFMPEGPEFSFVRKAIKR